MPSSPCSAHFLWKQIFHEKFPLREQRSFRQPWLGVEEADSTEHWLTGASRTNVGRGAGSSNSVRTNLPSEGGSILPRANHHEIPLSCPLQRHLVYPLCIPAQLPQGMCLPSVDRILAGDTVTSMIRQIPYWPVFLKALSRIFMQPENTDGCFKWSTLKL